MKNNKHESPKYRAIKRIEDKYGLMVFRCALSHLVSCGAQVLQNEAEVAECKQKIHAETPANSIMTAGFQCDIVDCAVELADIEAYDLFRYIQTDVAIDGWTEDEEEWV